MAMLAGVVCACGAGADTVQTAGATHAGTSAAREGGILVAGTSVPLDDVLSVVRDAGAATISAAQAIRLHNGEIWCGSILGMETNAISFRGNLFGECTIGAEAVASLDFARRSTPAFASKRGMLMRETGDPIPGSLLWIREDTLAIDCPLGVLPIPRQGAIRYQFRAPADTASRSGDDEIGLIDGSIYRGRLSLRSNGLEVAHALLGRVSLPWAAVRYLLRFPPDVLRLGAPAAGDVEARGPTPPSAAPQFLDYRTGLEPRPPSPACLTAVRMRPVSVARYHLTGREGRKAWFRAVVTPIPECRGDARIRLQVAGAPVLERTLLSTSSPVTVSIELPPGDELTLQTDFDRTLLYPCGVDWQDPCVVYRAESGK